MLELLLCSMFTIFPDYLYRRYSQGKQIGKEITLYSVWYELRYGITACLLLTLALITVVFFYHPVSNNVTAYFRTIPILPEATGRVAKVHVDTYSKVKKGDKIISLDDSSQQAALEVASRKIAEVDAAMAMAKADVAAAEGQIQQAQGAYQQALDELATKKELQRRNAGVVAEREIEKLQVAADGRKGAVTAAMAARDAAQTRLSTLLPAEKASAQASLEQAQVALNKMTVYAGVDGNIEQFTVRVGDVVSPIMRPAGVLIPSGSGREYLVAGFKQIEAPVMKVGMIAEAACASKPWQIIPMVVTGVQEYIAAGQIRASEQLLDPQQTTRPGTITVFMQPLYEGGLDGVAPGSSCVANAYTNNHERLANENLGFGTWLFLHMVDTVALVHALLLRLQALLLPVQALVLGGH